ncbi:MAG: hypothetical protein WBA07_06690 [Rivularia sp. (in: cyanobacteria)]
MVQDVYYISTSGYSWFGAFLLSDRLGHIGKLFELKKVISTVSVPCSLFPVFFHLHYNYRWKG